LIGHVEGMSAPRGISVDEANQRVYIANTGANNLVVISTQDWQVKTLVPLDGSPESLLLVPSAQRLYITLPEKVSVTAVDLHTTREINSIALTGRPESMAWDSNRMRLAVSLQDRKQVALLTPELQPAGSFAIDGSMPTGIVYDSQQDRYYLAIRYAVLELNAENGAEIARMPAAAGIDQLWLDPDERSLYGVANGSFFVMSAGSRLGSPRELSLDVKGHTLAFDPQRKLIYVPGGREGRSKLLILHRIGAEQAQPTQSAVASK
jgi:DNA-binding beta-propeller fold protein YncE